MWSGLTEDAAQQVRRKLGDALRCIELNTFCGLEKRSVEGSGGGWLPFDLTFSVVSTGKMTVGFSHFTNEAM